MIDFRKPNPFSTKPEKPPVCPFTARLQIIWNTPGAGAEATAAQRHIESGCESCRIEALRIVDEFNRTKPSRAWIYTQYGIVAASNVIFRLFR